jgi:hypothetical protein
MLSLWVYLVLLRLVDLASGSCSPDRSKDDQVLVLRHQLRVLRRQKGRPATVPADRILLASDRGFGILVIGA